MAVERREYRIRAGVCRAITSKAVARLTDDCFEAGEERLFTGLRFDARLRLTRDEWQQHREPIERFVEAGLLEAERKRCD